MQLTHDGQWKGQIGDIFQHTQQKELLCLLLEDTPEGNHMATKVRFITGNQYVNSGHETRVNLNIAHYSSLEGQ
jgi:hypothetical protein